MQWGLQKTEMDLLQNPSENTAWTETEGERYHVTAQKFAAGMWSWAWLLSAPSALLVTEWVPWLQSECVSHGVT